MEDKKISVLMANDQYYPVIDGVTVAMHNYIMQLKNSCDVCAFAPKITKSYVDDFEYEIIRCKSLHIPFFNVNLPLPKQDKKACKALDSKQIDIIHINSPFTICTYLIKLAKKKGIPIVATFHTKFRYEFRARLKSKKLAELLVKKIGKTLNMVDEVFIANDTLIDELHSYGYTGKTTIMPLGTDYEKNSNSVVLSESANRKYGFKSDDLVFLFVGRLEKVKNIDLTLDALALVKAQAYDFKYIIAGYGGEEKHLKNKVKKLNLSENVIFTGLVKSDELRELYSRADLLLFPSTFDTFGLVKVEASCFNTATLAVENSCASYGIIDGENGFLIKEDVNDYANKLIQIINNRQGLNAVGKRAGETLYCSWDDVGEQLLKRYKEIIEEHKNNKN